MSESGAGKKQRGPMVRWIRRGFLIWAIVSTLWLANSVRTRGVNPALLRSDAEVTVVDGTSILQLSPVASTNGTGLVFICGSGVAAQAYVPLLRPIAEAGYAVYIVKLPYRFAPLEEHKVESVERARGVVGMHPEISRWVIAGHSLGGAVACRAVVSDPEAFSALVLVGTTHPKRENLSSLPLLVTKVYGSNDGVAPPERMFGNKAAPRQAVPRSMPARGTTTWSVPNRSAPAASAGQSMAPARTFSAPNRGSVPTYSGAFGGGQRSFSPGAGASYGGFSGSRGFSARSWGGASSAPSRSFSAPSAGFSSGRSMGGFSGGGSRGGGSAGGGRSFGGGGGRR